MTTRRKRALKIISLLTAMLFVYAFLSWFLVRTSTTSEMHIKEFYKEPKNSMDIAIIGASEMYADYSPPLAYKKYGFTGYNYCMEGTAGQLYVPMLETYFSRQSPQLVVIEVNGFFYSEEYCKREANSRRLFDNIPLTAGRFGLVNKYVEGDKMSYYLPLIKHHSNWHDLSYQFVRAKRLVLSDFRGVSPTKSLGTRTTTDSQIKKYAKVKNPTLGQIGKDNLRGTIDFLKDSGVKQVLFIRAPHMGRMTEDSAKELEEIITDNGYDFLDCDLIAQDVIGLDEKTDYYNYEHLNAFGCEKFTDFLGKYITEHYQLDKTHTEDVERQWQECADFTEKVFVKLKERTLFDEDKEYYESNVYNLVDF